MAKGMMLLEGLRKWCRDMYRERERLVGGKLSRIISSIYQPTGIGMKRFHLEFSYLSYIRPSDWRFGTSGSPYWHPRYQTLNGAIRR